MGPQTTDTNRYRELGQARLDAMAQVKSQEDWEGGGPLLQATLGTPNGIEVQLWCMPPQPEAGDPKTAG